MHKSKTTSDSSPGVRTLIQGVAAFSLLFLAGLPIGAEAQDSDDSEPPLEGPRFQGAYAAQDHVNWLDGEQYDVLSGTVNHYVEDMRIPGNGTLPIVVARQHMSGRNARYSGIGGIGLAIPKIEFTSFGGGDFYKVTQSLGKSRRYELNHIAKPACSGLKLSYRVQNGGQDANKLDTRNLRSNIKFDDGQRTVHFFPRIENPTDAVRHASRFPRTAAYVSPDNWYITCDGTTFNVHTNEGTTYRMSTWFSSQDKFSTTKHLIFVNKITDVHENTIDYYYDDPGRPVLGGIYNRDAFLKFTTPRLSSIVASDGRQVTFEYGTGNFDFINRVYDNGAPIQREVTYLVESWGDRLTVGFEDDTTKEYRWGTRKIDPQRPGLTKKVLAYIKLRGGGYIKYLHEGIAVHSYVDKWTPGRFDDRHQTHRLLRRSLHTSADGPAVQQHEFGWRLVDAQKSEIARTISSASNTVEYRLKKIYPNSTDPFVLPPPLPYTRIKDSGRVIEFKNHGRRIQDAEWTADLVPELRQTYQWAELSSVVDFRYYLRRYPAHPEFAMYYESIVVAPKETKTYLRRIDGGVVTFTTTNNTFDDFGRPTNTVEMNNEFSTRTIQTNYHNTTAPWINGFVTRSEVVGANSVVNEYNPENGTLRRSTDNGVPTDYTYHANGELHTVENAEGHVQRYEVHYRGIPKEETDANGHVLIRSVNSDGTVASESVKGHSNEKTIYLYDSRRRIEEIKTPEDRRTSFKHLPWKTSSLNRGFQTVIRRDSLGREIFRGSYGSDGLGFRWSSVITRYDADGRVDFVSYPLQISDTSSFNSVKHGSYFEYDGLGRVIRKGEYAENANGEAVSVGGIAYEYNKNGLEVHEIDDVGNRTVNSYRAYGSPLDPMLVKTVDPSGDITDIERDSVGRVTSIDRNGVVREFFYNNLKQLERETHPESGATTYNYWSDGQLWTRDSGGVSTVFEYDGHNRLTKETLSETNGNSIERIYGYRNDDLLKWISNTSTGYSPSQATQTAYEYDWDGNLTSETLVVDDQRMNMEYEYDARGALSHIRYPTLRRYALHPNAHGWPTKMVDDAGKVVYDSIKHYPNGMIEYIERPNYRYTQSLWWLRVPGEIKSVGSGLKNARQLYRYYGNLNVSTIEGSTTAENLSLDYDKSSRLTFAKSGLWGTRTFEYDANDNFDYTTDDGLITSYSYDPDNNRLTSMKSALIDRRMSYDERGNMVKTGKHTLKFNSANQVLTSTDGATYLESYVYDGQGRRVKTVRDGKTVYQMYDQSGKLRYRSEPASNLESEYLYVSGKLFARRDTGDRTDVPEGEYVEIFRDDFDGDTVSSNFYVPSWDIPGRATVNNRNSCSQSGSILSLAINNVGNESQACYLISNKADIGPGEDSTIKVEFRANVSGVKAQGAWFAGWVYPEGLNGDGSHPAEDNNPATGAEFDVFEYMPTWDTAYNTAIHDGATEQQWVYGDRLGNVDLTQDAFRTYAMEWNKDCVVFSIDGVPTRGSESPLISSVQKHALYITMEAQTGKQWDFWEVGDFAQNLDANPTVGKVDWVSVSRKTGIDANLCDTAPKDDDDDDDGGDDPNGLTEPVVEGNVLSWPSEGWWEIQKAVAPYDEVCNTTTHGTSCTLEDGIYQAINHHTGDRYPNIVVPNGSNPDDDPDGGTGPTVNGNVLSWPAQGWWQIQKASAPYDEVCNTDTHGTSCTLDDGTYQAINHTTGDRYENIVVPNGGDGGGGGGGGQTEPTVEGNVLSWPSEGWWQIQYASAPHDEVCNTDTHGTSCTLDDGTYQAINHTTGDRYENIVVPNGGDGGGGGGGGQTEPTVEGNVLSWPSEGWWQIQNASAPHDEVCNTDTHGTSCTLDDGTYQAINHTTGDRYENIVVPNGGDGGGGGGGTNPGAPTAPTVTGQAYSSSAIEIQWSGASDSDGTVVSYDVYRNGALSFTVDGGSWWQEGLSANTEYVYEVVAIDNDGNRSPRSAPIAVRTNP